MDKEISPEVRRRARNKRLIIVVVAVAGFALLVWLLTMVGGRSIDARDIRLATADRGTIDAAISATGQVLPAFEQTITSPIASRIVEVYARGGDSLSAGTPLLLLDLEQAGNELKSLTAQQQIKRLEMEKDEIELATQLSNLEMQLEVKEMVVNRLHADYENELRLDSLGSGTGEKVRQAELAYKTGILELEQLRKQLDGARLKADASKNVSRLDMDVFSASIAEKQRTLDEAKLLSPRAATLTYIADEIGRRVSPGEKLAVIADLGHFKVEGQIADTYAARLTLGQRVTVMVGKEKTQGSITNIQPSSAAGVVAFTVSLPDNAVSFLRPGLRADLFVMTDIKADCVRIPRTQAYQGAGKHELWVMDADGSHLEKRNVMLGEGGTEYVEVKSGITPGEQVAISMPESVPASAKTLKIK